MDNRLAGPAPQDPSAHSIGSEEAMQFDMVSQLPSSSGYENIPTATDVFSRYLFTYLTTIPDAKTTAKVIFKLMTKNAYLPRTIISDRKRSAFVSEVKKELAEIHQIPVQHATTKHALTIGKLDRTRALLYKATNIETGKRISLWHKCVNILVLNYQTSYHASIGCDSSQTFYGSILYDVLEVKPAIRPLKRNPHQSHKSQKMFLSKHK